MIVSPRIPPELVEPVPISDRQARTLRDLSVLATEHLESALEANGRLAAVGQIVAEAEAIAEEYE